MRIGLKKFKFVLLVILALVVIGIIITAIWVVVWAKRNPDKACFYGHLSDAVAINKQRQPYYAEVTNGVSVDVSRQLISNERILMPVALLIDWQAQGFQRSGTPIVCKDFVDMQYISAAQQVSANIQAAPEGVFDQMEKDFEQEKAKMRKLNGQYRFKEISSMAYQLLLKVEETEQSTQSSFCMAKHVLESLGLAALHADSYAIQSGGSTNSLAKRFVGVKIGGLSKFTIDLDRKAQQSHMQGANIICNDVPDIPFRQEYELSFGKN